jgi:diguanylate cyclase (GGDEF)-like protein/PAS domain S-box-containing protein
MNLRLFTANIIVAIAYFVGGHAGLLLANLPGNAAAIWPAAGVALAAILVSGTQILPGILLGSIFVQTSAFLDASSTERIISSLSIGIIISVAAMCQAWIGAKLVRRIFDHDEALLKERSIILFCLLTGPVSCLVSATVSVSTLWFKEIVTTTDIPLAWSTWWAGDSIGVLVFTPIILCFLARPRHIWRQRINNVAIPLCILSILAFIVYDFSYKKELQHIEDEFEKNTINFKYELESNIKLHLNTTNDLKEFFDSSNKVTPEEFPRFVQPKLSRYPEIQALEWIPKVLHKDRESFEDHLGTQIKIQNYNGKMEVSGKKEFYFPIQYLEPITGNENALGFDISNNTAAMKAAEAACVSGKVTVSDAIKLMQETSDQISVVFYAPVYKKDVPIEKCESLSGFVASVFRLENEIINIQKKLPDIKLSVLLKNNSLLLFNNVPKKDKTQTIPNKFQLERSYQLPVANQQWDLIFSPTTGFISTYSSWTVWLIIVGGFLIAGLSGMGLLMLTGRTLQTEQKIKLRTAELQIEVIQHRLSKKAIAESEVKFRNLVEGSLQGIIVHNNFKPLFANQKCADIFGYSNPEEILELDSILEAFWAPEEHDRIEQYKTNRMKGDEVINLYECRGNRKDGSFFWFENHVTLVDWSSEKAIMGAIIDITDRKQTKDELLASNERIRAISMSSTIAMIIAVDQNGNIISWNSAAEKTFGYKETEILGTSLIEIIPERYRSAHKQGFQRAAEMEEFRIIGKTVELHGLKKNGDEFPIELSLGTWKKDEKRYFSAIINDISDRKQTEQSLSRVNLQLNTIIESEPDCVKTVSEEGNLLSMNPAGLLLVEAESFDEVDGVSVYDLLAPEYVDDFKDLNKRIFEGESVVLQFEVIGLKGGRKWMDTHAVPLYDESGEVTAQLAITRDITHRKQADEQLNYQASHDSLTGLINRHEFERRAERLLATAHTDKSEHAFCFMDLDQFKIVNDTSGHTAGDEMLRQLSTLLKDVVRHRDTLARLGGDEFGVLMEHCSLDDAHRVATSIQKAIQDFQFSWEGHSFKVGVSMGLVAITENDLKLSRILSDADIACYMAKDKGRNRIQVYYPEDAETAQRHGEMQWVTRINKAIEEEHFCLYAQVIEPLDKSNESHYEILIRMLGEDDDVIPPGAFLPAAERYNLISKIDRWVISATFDLLESHTSFLMKNGFCSINLSGQSLADMEFQEYVINQLTTRNIPPGKICFEITETAAITNLSVATLFLSKMKVLGCRFALDDFGSGLSSFGYLKNMEVDYLKIDGMFVKDIVDDPIDHAMVKSINEIGHVMGMQTIAEFVENDEIKGMLREIGVNYVQGYGIGKPVPFKELLINLK